MTDSEKIRELQAKIEILSTQNKGLEIAFDRLERTTDDLELSNKNLKSVLAKELTEHEAFAKNMKNVLEIEKKNAVEEFAEKLKKRTYCDNNFMDGKWHRYVFVEEIDELLKEYENDN